MNLLIYLTRTEDEIATVSAATEEDVDIAVKEAHRALKSGPWKTMPSTERGILMNRLADLMEKNRELLATIDAWDNGESKRSPLMIHSRGQTISIDLD